MRRREDLFQNARENRAARRLRFAVALLVIVFVLGSLVFGVGCTVGDDEPADALAERRAEVAARGGTVMPFDLERTTHVFQRMPDGGLQTVTSDDSADAEQVGLIRTHLRAEADRFAAGDFGDPAQIHGAMMPGLADLSAAAGAIRIEYSEVASGAAIRYSTDDPGLVSALHLWFDAQVSDHGDHAQAHPQESAGY
jgi:hypothetical protein